MIDPVSGNEVPPGALPEEVQDKENISASEGEYIIPADVVRFLGLDKIEKMIGKAKEQLAEMDASGRIGGKVPQEDQVVDAAINEVMAAPPAQPAFAQGGMVEGPGFSGTTGVKQFKGPDGRVMAVPFIGGKPLMPIPQGFVEQAAGATPVAQEQQQATQEEQKERSESVQNETFVSQNRNNTFSRPISEWSVDDFIGYGSQRGDFGNKVIGAVTGVSPMLGAAFNAHRGMVDRKTAEAYDQMLETRKDSKGNPLTRDQIVQVSNSRAALKDSLAKQSGLNLNPISRLTDVVDKVGNFLGLGQSGSTPTGQPRSATQSTYNANANAQGTVQRQSNGNAGSGVGGGNWSNGSGMGRTGPTSASIAEGGLYARGGLVTRRKK